MRNLILAAAVAASVSMPTVAQAQSKNVAQVAMSNPNFSTLVTAVKAAGLANKLATTKNITVFAPTNAAFAKVPKATLAALLKPSNKAQLVKVLSYHVLPRRVSAKAALSLPDGTAVKTLGGEIVKVSSPGSKVRVGNATVIMADVKASNGIIHAIDTVLIPPSVMRAMGM